MLIKEKFLEEGYYVFKNVIPDNVISYLRESSEDLLSSQTEEDRQKFRYQGSNISLSANAPLLAELSVFRPIFDCFKDLGFTSPRFWFGVLISKPAQSPALYWHQDWWGWNNLISYETNPSQIFVMCYLTDTSPENGCLRVIPKSHLNRHPIHNNLVSAHEEEPNESLFSFYEDEIDVPITVGDIVIGDSRLLHASHSNCSSNKRTCITLWYLSDWEALPDDLKNVVHHGNSENINRIPTDQLK